MWLIALLPVLAWATPDIPQAEVHRALQGAPAPVDPRILQAPPGVGVPPVVPPSPDGKGVYGTPYENHLDSENFSVNWLRGPGVEEAAAAASAALEEGWAAYVGDLGWRQPVSSDVYLLWVILDHSLSGTGLTTIYLTREYPDGYPVIYLNPFYAEDPDFWRSLAVHELHHAIQYAYRTWEVDDAESWYWEATAEWAVELAVPDADTYAWSAAYYAGNPWYRFDATADWHAYGMMVLNAWLHEGVGEDALRTTWEVAAGSPGVSWDAVLEAATGRTRQALWGGFTAAYAHGTLREGASYDPVAVEGVLQEGSAGTVPTLGTRYHRVGDPTWVEADGDVLLSSPAGWGRAVRVEAGDLLGVTGLGDGDVAYTLGLLAEPPDDTGLLPDSGTPEDTDGSGGHLDGRVEGGCGCAAPPWSRAWVGWGVGLLVILARRRRGPIAPVATAGPEAAGRRGRTGPAGWTGAGSPARDRSRWP